MLDAIQGGPVTRILVIALVKLWTSTFLQQHFSSESMEWMKGKTHFLELCQRHYNTTACNELLRVFGEFYASGTQDAEVTRSLNFN